MTEDKGVSFRDANTAEQRKRHEPLKETALAGLRQIGWMEWIKER